MRDAGAGIGIAGTQAPSLLLWQWELKMQKAAHPLEGAGTGSTRPTCRCTAPSLLCGLWEEGTLPAAPRAGTSVLPGVIDPNRGGT